jgi:16S rRNA (adenine1518-N6/adenine1519-N6)-dimethyltransferase
MKKMHGKAHGISLKKQYGQHFLRDDSITQHMIQAVTLTPESSVFEIGCGDGFLTRAILEKKLARLWVFEIDTEWAQYVRTKYPDERLVMHEQNILDLDFKPFGQYKPWILLSNLPYQITFPILHVLKNNRALLQEGVIMIQEEVAQKLVAQSGRSYGYISLYFQHYFEFKLLDKIKPTAFYPPPKVDSRLVYFKPRMQLAVIPREEAYWEFIKRCFSQPRRTLKNNLQSFHYNISALPADILLLRAQQMSTADFLSVWQIIGDNTDDLG